VISTVIKSITDTCYTDLFQERMFFFAYSPGQTYVISRVSPDIYIYLLTGHVIKQSFRLPIYSAVL